jgi:hypothetical protein
MAIAMIMNRAMKTLSANVIAFVSLVLMFLKSLKYSSTILLSLLLLANAVATAAFILSIEIVVKFLRWTRVASNAEVCYLGNRTLESHAHA